MKIVIDISEGIMEYVKNNGCLSVIYTDEVAKAIINGTLCEQTEVKGDLISREWLSNKFAEQSDYGEVDSNNGYFSLEEIYDLIDNAPPIETTIENLISTLSVEELKATTWFKVEIPSDEAVSFRREKTGHWIIDGHHYKCSRCGKTLAIMFSETDDDDLIGCPFCLADMRVKDELGGR